MAIEVGSRDLSELFTPPVEVEIEGLGSLTSGAHGYCMAEHVAQVQVALSGSSCSVGNVHSSPWEVVAFDRENKRIIVKPV